VLAHVEGFMTWFHLADPAALDKPEHSAWTELLGALEQNGVAQWTGSDQSVRNEALGRLQEYYCHALDKAHRDVFDGWVRRESSIVAADRALQGRAAPGDVDDEAFGRISSGEARAHAAGREVTMLADFVDGLRQIVRGGCRVLRPPMRL
jgi:hypothetical protein